jgi:uncharacterized protein (TIGR02452 family)
MPALEFIPCLDNDEMAAACRRDLDLSRGLATELGKTALEISDKGEYQTENGRVVRIAEQVARSLQQRVSIPPNAKLPEAQAPDFSVTRCQVINTTTLRAARQMSESNPLALNFANGIEPGGGFLWGARAQEECLCRSSALYVTLRGDPMYEAHRKRPLPDSTDWSILSPDVPVFRTDAGDFLDEPWNLSFLTCAAPYAPGVGQPESGDLLQQRIHRVLAIARGHGYTSLVLGAWGCGAFGNDARRTARDFRSALEGEFAGAFSDVVFAVTDWSSERRFLSPFRDVFQ